LAASAAPSTQHTPDGEFSTPGFEEDRKPHVEYLDSLNEHNKRSRSVENEGDAERKQARVSGDGDGDGWSQGQGQQGQENGEQQQQLPVLPMNGVESSAPDAEGVDVNVVVGEEDPLVYGLSSFCRLLFDFDFFLSRALSLCRAQWTFIFQWMAKQCRSLKLERSTTT
jgi:hypothetical protein